MTRHTFAATTTLCAALLFPSNVRGQQSAAEAHSLQQELVHLGIVADALEHSLPSLTCQEDAVSENLERGNAKQHVAYTAMLRAVRAPEGKLDESFTLSTLNGKPYSGDAPSLPMYVAGGFDSAMQFFLPSRQACYRYTLSPGRIDFETNRKAARPGCRDDGLHGFALLDANGDVTHLENRVSAEATQEFHIVPYAAIDFVPVDLGGHTFRITGHLVAEAAHGRSTGRFEATFTGCHLFAVTVTIDPGSETVPADPAASR